jgi:hypothetical protein
MLKRYIILLLAPLVYIGCSSGSYSEEYLYNFGLNPPVEVYNFVDSSLTEEDCSFLYSELDTFPIVGVLITVKDSIISECSISNISQTKEVEALIRNVFVNKQVTFSFMEEDVSFYNFRLHLDRLCEGKK